MDHLKHLIDAAAVLAILANTGIVFSNFKLKTLK